MSELDDVLFEDATITLNIRPRWRRWPYVRRIYRVARKQGLSRRTSFRMAWNLLSYTT